WTETGPFSFEGKHYQFEYVNLWPRPYQTPRPPIWIPSQGSSETIDWASHPDRRYTYLQTFTPVAMLAKYMQMYKDKAAEHGYEA
ncbi:LLM class flavin-dependent oxidoreductase, partial [Klebsiella pneumoniae]|nr:LLM class flavin-dependent oxidoreductase [Klebsiella pneumoniae]